MRGQKIGAEVALRGVACAAFTVVFFFTAAEYAAARECPVLHPGTPSAAEKALRAADYSKAAELYRAAMAADPGDTAQVQGLVHALLREQKVKEAADTVGAALAATPSLPALLTLRGEVEYRQGEPWTAAQSANESLRLDPCNPRTYLLLANLYRINSLYATAWRNLQMAHRLSPDDPEIRKEWMATLPLHERIAELEAYLAQPGGDDADNLRYLHEYLNHLKKQSAEPPKPCRLVSQMSSTQIPFAYLMSDATHVGGFGLEVKLNNHNSRLQIDTGAGGLLVSSAVAKRAGLKAASKITVFGVGDEGSKSGYMAYADSIRIGDMEFQNCTVQVVDGRNMPGDVDGLIGTDVFSSFLVTLDYPAHKLTLGPLPARPGEDAAASRKLKMGDDDEDTSEVQGGQQAAAGAGASPTASGRTGATVPRGLYDRYITPETQDYTKIYRFGHNLLLPTGLNASKIKLLIIDTGAWTTVISPQAAREVTKVHGNESMEIEGLSGTVDKVYVTDTIVFRFAHMEQKGTSVVAFDTSKISKSAGMEISGFLGAATLNQLTVHIDYRDGLVKFDYDPKRLSHF